MTTSTSHRHIKKTATLIFVGEAGGPRSIPQNGIPKSYQDGLYNCSLDKTGISKYVKDNYVINGTFFQKYWRKSGNRHYSGPRLFHLKTPKLLPKNAYFIAKFLKFADGDAEAPLSVFLFHYKYHFKEAEEYFVSSALIFATQK